MTEPLDVPTTMVEVPTLKVAPTADVSIDFSVRVEEFVVRVPVAVTVRLDVPVRL